MTNVEPSAKNYRFTEYILVQYNASIIELPEYVNISNQSNTPTKTYIIQSILFQNHHQTSVIISNASKGYILQDNLYFETDCTNVCDIYNLGQIGHTKFSMLPSCAVLLKRCQPQRITFRRISANGVSIKCCNETNHNIQIHINFCQNFRL